LLLVGSPQAARSNAATGSREPAELSGLRAKANQRYAAGAFDEAADLYAAGYQRSLSLHNPRSAMLFLIALGGVRVITFHYQAALDSLLEARRIGESSSDFASLGMIWSNLSSLYLAVGDLPGSRIAAERALNAADRAPQIPYRGQLLAQVGYVHAQAGETKQAIHYFRQAVELLDNLNDANPRATVLAIIGRQLLHLGDTAGADAYLTEAFRQQKMFRGRDVRFTYFGLSELRLAQHDIGAASVLIDMTTRMAAKPDRFPEWWVDRQRGDIRLAENRVPEAVESYGRAIEKAREWREEAAPSDPSGIGTDTDLHHLYGAYIEASLRLGHPPFEEVFLAVEEDRAAALRREVRTIESSSPAAGMKYWEKLAQLRASETQLVASDTEQNRAKVQSIGFELNELEARDKIGLPRVDGERPGNRFQSRVTLSELQERIRPQEALLSFYQGEEELYVWGVTRDGIEFHSLAGAAHLAELAGRFREAVQTGAAQRDELGEQLHRALFDQLSETVRTKRYWLVTADTALFEVPLAALSEQTRRPAHLPVRTAQPSAHPERVHVSGRAHLTSAVDIYRDRRRHLQRRRFALASRSRDEDAGAACTTRRQQ
jgi:tetratricopeptide (TPR) repeat protein